MPADEDSDDEQSPASSFEAVGDTSKGGIHQARDIVHGPIETNTDNSGAYNLCYRTTVGKNSKHVERRVYKMRELKHQGIVRVNLIPTAEMPADLLTKALTTIKHSTSIASPVMNLV